MTVSAAPGSNERTVRSAPVAVAGALDGAPVGRQIRQLGLRQLGLIDGSDVGGLGLLLLVVGLLLGLILITAGCGPPS
ncbi:MAG TPA: hypothetical protein VHW23_45800 [Kofleriaceae bacterium]|jgi:hypothetical protein|nr:hypothetical protein [Kofleriaceae bacterium]